MIFATLVQGERNGKKILFFVAIPDPSPNLRRQLVFAERSLTSANPSISIPQKFAFFPITQSHAV